jgi:quercetin 2,3-dioxygenase
VIVRSRTTSTGPGRASWHSFAFGSAWEPDNTHFGLLLACNEERLEDGAGFDPHPHRDVEVVTWVLSGAVRHTDSLGRTGEARPGVVQRMSAGDGVRHSEHATGGPAHYVQMWLRPTTSGPPLYDTLDVGPFEEVTPLRQPDAVLRAGLLTGSLTLAPAAYLHVLVVTGEVAVGGDVLRAGDALRARGTGPTELVGRDAHVLAWLMRKDLISG